MQAQTTPWGRLGRESTMDVLREFAS
jgi:hypothetical protein